MFKHSKYGAFAATLGMVLALGGASFAVADGGYDIPSRGGSVASEPAGVSPVIGKSWMTWIASETDYPVLPATAPQYSQINFLTSSAVTGSAIKTAQGAGQMHAEGMIELRNGGSADAHVWCDMRIDGNAGSNPSLTTVKGGGGSVTIPLVGSKAGLAAGDHNAGVRCWAPVGSVQIHSAELHAVVYGASVPG